MLEYSHPFIPELMPFWYLTSFLLGTCIGSYLNVVIYRVPAEISLISPGSPLPEM